MYTSTNGVSRSDSNSAANWLSALDPNQQSRYYQQTRQRLLRTLSLSIIVIYLLLFVILTIFSIQFSMLVNWLATASFGVGVVVAFISYRLSRQARLVTAGTWLIVLYSNLLIYVAIYVFGPNRPVPAVTLLLMMFSLFLLPDWATFIFSLIGTFITVTGYLFGFTFANLGEASYRNSQHYLDALLWAIFLILPTLVGVFLARQLRRTNDLVFEQTTRLNHALQSMEAKRQFGQSVSNEIQTVTYTLNSTASQQSEGSQQQVDELGSITSLFIELTQTAESIEARSQAVAKASNNAYDSIQKVRSTSTEVAQAGERGLHAVEQTLARSQGVSEFYTGLVETLTALQRRSDELTQVVSLLQNISSETHLLALNAAIEAAGAGEQGSRFKTVAHEVKSLADRSLRSTKTVRESLSQIGIDILEAVTKAQVGFEEIHQAELSAQRSGRVIEELASAVEQSSQEVETIQAAIGQMVDLTHQTSVAASVQSSTSRQVLGALQKVGIVARQSAGGSINITQTSHKLEELASDLVTALEV